MAAGTVVCGAVEEMLGSNQAIMLRNSSIWPALQGISTARTPVIFRILKLLGRLRTMKVFAPLVAPLVTSNHLRGE